MLIIQAIGLEWKLNAFLALRRPQFLYIVNSWLVVWIYKPFEAVFQSILGRLPKRRRKAREKID